MSVAVGALAVYKPQPPAKPSVNFFLNPIVAVFEIFKPAVKHRIDCAEKASFPFQNATPCFSLQQEFQAPCTCRKGLRASLFSLSLLMTTG
jgi:hypothetical protein